MPCFRVVHGGIYCEEARVSLQLRQVEGRRSTAGRKIVVMGGGFGGTAAARTARAALDLEHKVTLIDRDKRTYLCGSFPLLIVRERGQGALRAGLASVSDIGVARVYICPTPT